MPLTLSDSVLEWTSLSAKELKLDIAVMLFQKEKLTLAQAFGWRAWIG